MAYCMYSVSWGRATLKWEKNHTYPKQPYTGKRCVTIEGKVWFDVL